MSTRCALHSMSQETAGGGSVGVPVPEEGSVAYAFHAVSPVGVPHDDRFTKNPAYRESIRSNTSNDSVASAYVSPIAFLM